eukprot:4416230-Ditylum_brightwellii.AAC.1
MVRHGIETDSTPVCLEGTGSMVLQEEEFPFEWDEENFLSGYPNRMKRGGKGRIHNGVTLEEWRKRLAMLSEDVVKKTLSNCTNLYFNVEMENRQDLHCHFKYRFPGTRYTRQTETVSSDTFFPTVKMRR